MQQIKLGAIAPLNENVLAIVKAASKDRLSVGSLLKELFSRKNVVSNYIANFADLNLVQVDFSEKARESNHEGKVSADVIDLLQNIDSQNRYHDELSLMIGILNGPRSVRNVVESVLSKYVDLRHMRDDLMGMQPTAPILAWESNAGSILNDFGTDLTLKAHNGELDPVLNRDSEVQRMVQILIRKTKSNPILIGEPGTGKTAIVEGLASILNAGVGIPVSLVKSKLIQLDMAAIASAGAAGPGALEKILDAIIQAAKAEDAILFIDEVHVIMDNNAKMANALKPAMSRGDIRLIGATTVKEYKAAFDNDEAMQRRFQPVKVEESDKTSVYRILQQKARQMEEFHNVIVPNESLLHAIALSDRFIPDRNQPDKAIDLIEEASSKLRMTLESKPDRMVEIEQEIGTIDINIEMLIVKAHGEENLTERDQESVAKYRKKKEKIQKEYKTLNKVYKVQKELIDSIIEEKGRLKEAQSLYEVHMHAGEFVQAQKVKTEAIPAIEKKIEEIEQQILTRNPDETLVQNVVMPNMVAEVIEVMTGIPASAQSEDDLKKYKNIEKSLMKKVHGQDRAVKKVSEAIKRSKAGLSGANKPIGSFIFFGPTGVGKTYMAQSLAKFMFDTDKVLHRYDMSEFMEPHSVSKLFGSPPGYVGFAEGGQLTEAVRRNPYSIILFDEIEKAHPRVFDTLLQVLDAGRMTDGQGHVVDFKNTIIIMTSNIGSSVIQEGLSQKVPTEHIESALIQEAGKHFRPEFLNRFDAKIMFESLSLESVVKIAESELKKFAKNLFQTNEIDLHWAPVVPAGIAIVANDPLNGARPINRFINDTVVNQLTEMILTQEIENGGRAYLDIFGEEFVVTAVTKEELKEIKAENKLKAAPVITQEMIDANLPKAKVSPDKVQEEDIVDAIIDEETEEKTEELHFPETENGDRQ